MTAENPDNIDTAKWFARTRRKLAQPSNPRAWTMADFKLTLLFADRFTREELLSVLDISTGKRFDNRAGIEDFHRLLAGRIDARGE